MAAYCRVSTDDKDQVASYNAQVAYYTDAIAKNPHWRFVEIYADKGLTGTESEHRERFKKMIKDCKKGRIDYILTKSVARFARNTVDSLKYARKLKALGIGVYFEEQHLDTLKMDSELQLGLYSVLAQAESENISANVRWGIRRRMETGTFKFRYNLLGYKKGEDGEPEIVEEEAKHIREIYRMFLDGFSIDQIKEYLDKSSVKTISGNDVWSKNAIRNILTNERYTGDMLLQKTYTLDCISKKVEKNRGKFAKYLISNNHPAIIDRETYKRVQTEIARRQNKRKVSDTTITEQGKFSGKYPLSELLICGDCGSPYRRWQWGTGNKKRTVWRCLSRIEHGKTFCEDSITIEDGLLHEIIKRALTKFAKDKENVLLIIFAELANEVGTKDEMYDILAINQSIAELDKKMENAAILEATTEGNKERIREEIIQLSQEIVALRERRDFMNSMILAKQEKERTLEEYKEELKTFDIDFSEMPDYRLKRFVHNIRVMKDKIIITMKDGQAIEENII